MFVCVCWCRRQLRWNHRKIQEWDKLDNFWVECVPRRCCRDGCCAVKYHLMYISVAAHHKGNGRLGVGAGLGVEWGEKAIFRILRETLENTKQTVTTVCCACACVCLSVLLLGSENMFSQVVHSCCLSWFFASDLFSSVNLLYFLLLPRWCL